MLRRDILFVAIIFFISTVIFLFNIVIVKAQISNNERSDVLTELNNIRSGKGLNILKTDSNICKVASMLAEDSERSYPDPIDRNLFTNLSYKEYLKNYSNYDLNKLTINDLLADLNKKTGMLTSFPDDQLVRAFSSEDSYGAAMNPKLTHGCVAVSSGDVGYKPFAYFVGATEKTVMDKFPLNILKTLLIKLGLYKV